MSARLEQQAAQRLAEDPVCHLNRLRQALATGEPVPPEIARWLIDGIDQHVQGLRLDTALGLRGPGRETLQSRWNRAQRDVAIRDAAALAGGVQALAQAMTRFRAGRWRHWCDLPAAPEEKASPLDQALHRVFRLANGAPPTSVKQLRRICSRP